MLNFSFFLAQGLMAHRARNAFGRFPFTKSALRHEVSSLVTTLGGFKHLPVLLSLTAETPKQ